MTPEEFKIAAQNLYNFYCGSAGGHYDIDELMADCLRSLGYKEGVDILFSMDAIWYS